MDRFDLERFVSAQASTYAQALAELRDGHKRSHWMWFVFPQLAGLGRSDTARFYAIDNLAEAQAYLAHRVLGARYRECAAALLAHDDRCANDIFGAVDAMKLRSSLTLFAGAGGGSAVEQALGRYFDSPDPATERLLQTTM